MRAEERIAQLERELAEQRAKSLLLETALAEQQARSTLLETALAEQRAEHVCLRQQMEQALARLCELEGRLAKDSHHSSKPPSGAGPTRKTHSQRQPSGKKTGGQPGHPGCSLQMAQQPDEVVRHRPRACMHCQQELEGVGGQVSERRPVHDLPQWRLLVSEHQVEQVTCPRCQQVSRGSFPAEVSAPVQYGPRLRALAVYLHE